MVTPKHGEIEAFSACPVFDNKQIAVFNGVTFDRVDFCDGIATKVETLIRGWFPKSIASTIHIKARRVSSEQYANFHAYSDCNVASIVRDLLKTIIFMTI